MYENIKITKIAGSKIEIRGSVKAKEFSSFRKKALENINNEITVDGFRKGKVPENVITSKVGDMTILEEMAELTLSKVYPEIIMNEKIDALGRPEIQITKIAHDNPLEFKITTTVVPEIKLGDYKKIAKKEMGGKDIPAEVTDAEVEDAILRIRKSRVDHSGHDHGKISKEEHEKMIADSLPELTDAFAQSFGDFKDVADLKEKVTKALMEDKESQKREKKRIAFSDAIIEASEIDVPEILTENEMKRTEMQFTDDIQRMGATLEEYLKHAKKSIEDIRKEWRPLAKKKAKLQLILNKISEQEKIEASEDEIEKEVKHIVEHYKDADRDHAHTYAQTVLTNEKVFQFIEAQK